MSSVQVRVTETDATKKLSSSIDLAKVNSEVSCAYSSSFFFTRGIYYKANRETKFLVTSLDSVHGLLTIRAIWQIAVTKIRKFLNNSVDFRGFRVIEFYASKRKMHHFGHRYCSIFFSMDTACHRDGINN